MQRDWQLLHPYKSAVPPISTNTTSFLSMHFHALSNRYLILKGIFLYISESLYIVLLATPSQNFPTKLAELRRKPFQLQWRSWQSKVPAVHAHKPSPPPMSPCPPLPSSPRSVCTALGYARSMAHTECSQAQVEHRPQRNHYQITGKLKSSSFSPTSSRQEGTWASLTSACTINTPSFRFIITGHFPIWNCLLTWTNLFFTMYLHLIIQQAWLSWVLIIINTLLTSL